MSRSTLRSFSGFSRQRKDTEKFLPDNGSFICVNEPDIQRVALRGLRNSDLRAEAQTRLFSLHMLECRQHHYFML